MKPTKYKKIVVEGFQSFGNPTSFPLDLVGINLIKGVNGAGKSTVFNALFWAEYGGNFKKSVETWEENRPESYRGVRVVVERTDGEYDYMIARHLNFKGSTKGLKGGDKLMIFRKPVSQEKFEQSDLIGDGLHKSDMQEMINKQLGMDERTFLNSIMFGQRMKSLVEAPNADKRKLFEELFALDFVDIAKEKAKAQEVEISTLVTGLTNDLGITYEKIETTEDRIAEQTKIKENFIKEKNERLATLDEEISLKSEEVAEMTKKMASNKADLKKFDSDNLQTLTDNVETLSKLASDAKDVEKAAKRKYDDCEKAIIDSKNRIRTFEDNLKNVEDTCPHCLGPISAEKVKDVKKSITDSMKSEQKVLAALEKEKPKYLKQMNDAIETYRISEENHESAVTVLRDFKEGSAKFFELEKQCAVLEGSITSTKSNIKNLEAMRLKEESVEMPMLIIEQLEADLVKHEKTVTTIMDRRTKENAKLEKVQWWIKVAFGASGLKSFVFNSMLNQLNLYAQKYAGRLGFGVEFTVDMTKASKPFQTLVYKGDTVKNYEDFSGGQKQRVDVCLAFAMHDLITHKSDINILIMDEIFEGLDNLGIEAAFDLIRQKAENRTVFLITHSDIIDSLNSRTIFVDLDENENSYIQA